MSSYYVTKIVQDKYGFLWVGTQEGLNLFDGIRFRIFSGESVEKHNIGGSFIGDLVEDRKRSLLWVVTSYGDVCAINLATRIVEKKISHDGEGKKFSEKWIRCLQLQGDILWICGLNTISAYNVEEDRFLDTGPLLQTMAAQGECNIAKMVRDNSNRMWLFSEGYGVVVIGEDLKPVRSFNEAQFSSPTQQKLLFREAIVNGDAVYTATSRGLFVFNSGKKNNAPFFTKGNMPGLSHQPEIRALVFTGPSTLLFSTPSRVYSFDTGVKKITEIEDENPDNTGLRSVFQMHYDSLSGKIWAGSQSGLSAFTLEESAFQAFSKSRVSSTKIKHLYGVLPVSDREVYAGDENGVYWIDTHTREIVRMDTSSGNFMLFGDAAKNIFLSNLSGLHLVRNKKLIAAHKVFPELHRLESDLLSSGLQYNDSLILFASAIQKGLYVWNSQSRLLTTFHGDSARHAIPGLSIINYLFRGAGPDVFVLTEKSVVRFNPVTGVHSVHKIGSPSSKENFNLMDMCETDRSYWFATYGAGLVETDKDLNPKGFITVKQGLSNNCIYRVFNYNDRSVIATSNNGLSIINTGNYDVDKYFKADGLHGSAFEQLCGYTLNGKIYAGGADGFTIIDPVYLSVNRSAPALYMQNIRIETQAGAVDTCNLAIREIVVPNNVLQTTLNFSALNYRNPRRVSYQYRIDELGDEWIDIGNQDFVNLIGLRPGTYRFQVRASNEEGIRTEPLELTMTYLPKWYQTIWFRLLLLLSGGLVIYGIQLYRIGQIKKQQQIRREIANDLHDDIGSTLNSLKIFAHLAQHDADNKEHVLQIESSVSTATVSLRDMIWVLDDDQDSLYELMERIKKFALPVCMVNSINLVTSVDAASGMLVSKKAKRNLLLIAKESVNNAIKYAACQNIRVTLIQTKNLLTLKVEDDGRGFNIGTLVPGKGLASIRYRAGQIAFKCDIISIPGKGTTIELSGKG
ncbi:hypothetical protein KK083_07365 [Fulvivirgaceae bacterium PWU4]|uniref:histidine kinase n=1 Tax=Chryseosolibacter histidini TaxID=2782349 RepID=A0AAP2DI19_9BACT|nr:triple tyrosine motif-containing protein [Chryseosolibacter histidini]MBT1696686.1 hypothetical protein [Chryseosolibacter histidini]